MPTTRSQVDAADVAAMDTASGSARPATSSVRGAPGTSRPLATSASSVRGAPGTSRPLATMSSVREATGNSRPTATPSEDVSSRETSAGTSGAEYSTPSGTTHTWDSTNPASTDNTASTNVTAKPRGDSERALRSSQRAKSRHSESERKRKLRELEAREKVAALRLEEIQARLALAEAQRERLRAAATDEEDLASASENEESGDEERSSRVQEWLEGQPEKQNGSPEEVTGEVDGRGQGACSRDDGKCKPQVSEAKVYSRDGRKCEHRETEARPARHPPTADVASLAAALTQAVRMTRDAPKYLQELPIFNGQAGSWLTFRAAYDETENMFSRTENVARLRRSLKGVAHEAVSSLLISAPEPRAIVEALERRFGRPDALATSEIQKMKSLGKMGESPRDLCIFANKVSNITATLEALKKIHYLHNPELVTATIEKLTPILRNKWYDYAAREKEDIPDLKRLTAFLNEEADKWARAHWWPQDVATFFVPNV